MLFWRLILPPMGNSFANFIMTIIAHVNFDRSLTSRIWNRNVTVNAKFFPPVSDGIVFIQVILGQLRTYGERFEIPPLSDFQCCPAQGARLIQISHLSYKYKVPPALTIGIDPPRGATLKSKMYFIYEHVAI